MLSVRRKWRVCVCNQGILASYPFGAAAEEPPSGDEYAVDQLANNIRL
jgi:hypothetical protein